MKIIVFFILFLACINLSAAETGENALNVSYSALSRYSEDQTIPEQETFILSVDDEKSVFAKIVDDKIETHNYMIFKNYPQSGEVSLKDECDYTYKCYYTEPMPDFDWQMLDGDSIVCDYKCQKAKVTYRKRTWIVWYSLDLPYPDGPWKLSGLPGLILKAQDVAGDFSFSAFKVRTGKMPKVSFSFRGYDKVTPRKYEELYSSQFEVLGVYFVIGGQKKAVESRIPCLLEELDDKE